MLQLSDDALWWSVVTLISVNYISKESFKQQWCQKRTMCCVNLLSIHNSSEHCIWMNLSSQEANCALYLSKRNLFLNTYELCTKMRKCLTINLCIYHEVYFFIKTNGIESFQRRTWCIEMQLLTFISLKASIKTVTSTGFLSLLVLYFCQ